MLSAHSRRNFLIGAGTAAVAMPAPVVLTLQASHSAALASAPTMTAQERLDLAVAELKAAAEAIYPEANDWKTVIGSEGCPVLIAAWTSIGKSASESMYPAKPGSLI